MILKTLALPQIQLIFLLGIINVPDRIILEIDTILFNVVWAGKPPKLKTSTIIAPVNDGGLGMIDIYAVNMAAKGSWLKDYLTQNEKKAMLFMLNVDTKV